MSCDFLEIATDGVRGLRPYQPGKPIEELQRELRLTEVIKLASNENPLGAGPRARAAIEASITEISRYPDGNGFALKRALAAELDVPPAALTLGNGSNDVLELIVRAFVTVQHEVIFSQHAFAVYALATQAVGAKAVVTPACQWGHDLDAMTAAVNERTRVMFVANPNNPTGTWSRASELERLAEATPDHVLLVVDEAYYDYVGEADYPSCVDWVARFPNLIVTRTFSKVHGLAGLRVGFAVSDPAVAEILNRVRQPFNVNGVAMAAATAALDDRGHVARSVAHNRAELTCLKAGFDRLGLDYIPSVGNFVCVDVGPRAAEIYSILLKQGIIVRPVEAYGMPTHLRVTAGLEAENSRFLDELERAIGG